MIDSRLFSGTDLTDILFKICVIILILIATVVLSKLSKKLFQKRIDKSTMDVTHLNFIKHFLSGVIYFVGIALMIYQIDYLKSISVSILASSGVVAVILGFASQQTFANIVSGFFISIYKPFRIGDRIRFTGKNTIGIVEDITLRHTIIRTFENSRVIIPNNIINNELIENMSIIEDKTCGYLDIGISYDEDIDKAMEIIKNEITGHKDFYDNRTKEETDAGKESADVKLIGFGESALNLRAWVWAKDPATGYDMLCDLRKSIKEKFDKEEIGLAYPSRTIMIRYNTRDNTSQLQP